MMEVQYLGNIELLKQPITAFLASSKIPVDLVLRCYDWASQTAQSEQCIVSGFSSHLEKEVLHFLMKGRCPIILVLARSTPCLSLCDITCDMPRQKETPPDSRLTAFISLNCSSDYLTESAATESTAMLSTTLSTTSAIESVSTGAC